MAEVQEASEPDATATDDAETAQVQEAAQGLDFSGHWDTNYGLLILQQDGESISGSYESDGTIGTVQGILEGNIAMLAFRDNVQSGEAKFELNDNGRRLSGAWRPEGNFSWQPWNGRRTAAPNFSGLWDTSYGKMRLVQNGDEVEGFYNFRGIDASVIGQVRDERLIFRYAEPSGEEGAALFELSSNGNNLTGKYRPDGQRRWADWTGERVEAVKDRVWLIILEANWETTLDEPQYAFSEMLEEYFTMGSARHVEVRRRSFHDSTDLKRFCMQVKYVPGPVVLLISTHGSPSGISVFNETIGPEVLADCVSGTSNLKLLHLSGCSMMAGSYPDSLHRLLKDQPNRFPITGYTTDVDWDASALGDFTFLSMLLIHELEPEAAVREAIRVAPHLGNKRMRGSVYQPLGLTIAPVPAEEPAAVEMQLEPAAGTQTSGDRP
ncbi:MAG: hypothetical protein AAF456_08455 [Planctomycetota bacterium]